MQARRRRSAVERTRAEDLERIEQAREHTREALPTFVSMLCKPYRMEVSASERVQNSLTSEAGWPYCRRPI